MILLRTFPFTNLTHCLEKDSAVGDFEYLLFRNFYDLGFTTQLIVKVPTIILDISVLFSYNSMFLRL